MNYIDLKHINKTNHSDVSYVDSMFRLSWCDNERFYGNHVEHNEAIEFYHHRLRCRFHVSTFSNNNHRIMQWAYPNGRTFEHLHMLDWHENHRWNIRLVFGKNLDQLLWTRSMNEDVKRSGRKKISSSSKLTSLVVFVRKIEIMAYPSRKPERETEWVNKSDACYTRPWNVNVVV